MLNRQNNWMKNNTAEADSGVLGPIFIIQKPWIILFPCSHINDIYMQGKCPHLLNSMPPVCISSFVLKMCLQAKITLMATHIIWVILSLDKDPPDP